MKLPNPASFALAAFALVAFASRTEAHAQEPEPNVDVAPGRTLAQLEHESPPDHGRRLFASVSPERRRQASNELGASAALFAGGGVTAVVGVVTLLVGLPSLCLDLSFAGSSCPSSSEDTPLVHTGIGLGIAGAATLVVGAILTFGFALPTFQGSRRRALRSEAPRITVQVSTGGGELRIAGRY